MAQRIDRQREEKRSAVSFQQSVRKKKRNLEGYGIGLAEG
jgi:hypothetical protein